MWTRLLSASLLALSLPASAQEPISAIDWLSDVIQTPTPDQPAQDDVTDSAEPEEISVAPLEDVAMDGVGLLPASVSRLPRDFWGPTAASQLAELFRMQDTDLVAPARDLLMRIALAELDPPIDAGEDHALFLARIDMLLSFGALEQAQALVERAGPTRDVEVFRRWFDISLLLGNENRACAAMRVAPDIAPTFSARVFCLARGNDWAAAALSLETARALGFVTEAEDLLMARFLDPELFEGMPLATPPSPMTPLSYQMLAALGEAPPPSGLPVAFNHALLSDTKGWKTRLEAGERLARTGGIAPSSFFALYTERRPAASGGVWDRVSAVQEFDVALVAGDIDRVNDSLPRVAAVMRDAGLETVLARHYGPRLARMPLSGAAHDIAEELVLLTREATHLASRVGDPLYGALAAGKPPVPLPPDPFDAAVASAFLPVSDLPQPYFTLVAEKRQGEAALRALGLIGRNAADGGDMETALRVLRELGFEQTAREVALALLIDRNGQ